MAFAQMQPGALVLIRYDEDVFHERLVCGELGNGEMMICTPDYDFYAEELSANNDDITSIRFFRQDAAGNVSAPPGVLAVHAFPAMTHPDMEQLIREGLQLAQVERNARHLPPLPYWAGVPAFAGARLPPTLAPNVLGAGVVLPLAVAPALAVMPLGGLGVGAGTPGLAAQASVPTRARGRAPQGGCWIVDEPSLAHQLGDIVALGPGAVLMHDRVLSPVSGEVVVLKHLDGGIDIDKYIAAREAMLGDDMRVLPRNRDWKEGRTPEQVELMDHDDELKFHLTGPRTATWFLQKMMQGGSGNFVARHHTWVREANIPAKARAIHEHEALSKILDGMVNWDRLNAKNHLSAEIALRRLQLIEEVHREDPTNPSWEEGSSFYMGDDAQRGGALLAPGLRSHVAAELQREALILKEKRKARDARKGAANQK